MKKYKLIISFLSVFGFLYMVLDKEYLDLLFFLSLFSFTAFFFLYLKEQEKLKILLEKNNELKQFANALDETAIVSKTNLRGKITYVNDKFCEISGYTKDELVGKPHNIVRHPDMDSEVFKKLWQTIKSKKVFKETIKNKTKTNDDYIVDSVIIPILDTDGEIKEYLGVRYFVTEFVKSRDEALKAEKIKDEFISNVSHELRTPLNAIGGFSELLKHRLDDEVNKKYINQIINSTETILNLVNDILDLSKIKSGNFKLEYKEFNPAKTILIFLDNFEFQIKNKNLTLDVQLDKSLKTNLYGDWLRISQIITNLLSNAIKFTPNGKKITFISYYDNNNLVIEIKDEGIGMSEDALERIFKPFEQADISTTRKYGGTGLGLSIVLNLVKQMNGKINVISKENEGSSFLLYLPLENRKLSKLKLGKEEKEIDMLKGHILVAEDDMTNQILFGAMLSQIGVSYDMAKDGEEALDMFCKNSYDLVMLDENMPKKNGSEVMKEIRKTHNKDIPIVALTADAMEGVKEKYLSYGMNGYISKPIHKDELYKVLKELLDS